MIAELRGVTKKYGEVVALANVTLGLEPGCVTAILGPNGAGKTSAVQVLLGLTRPTSGRQPLRHATLATSTRRMSSIP
jgi:ABC-2 type transport system ATP-binding protein